MNTTHVVDISGTGPVTRVTVADLSYSGRNRVGALRSAARRAIPGSVSARIVSRQCYPVCAHHDSPRITFQVIRGEV